MVPPRFRWDVLVAGLLSAATLLVHDVGYLFSQPLWTDESWVAISTKLPLRDLLRVSASTPVGWTLLLRLVPSQGTELLRIVPLIFTALTVVVAYVFVRSLPWTGLLLGRTAAALAGASTLLSRSNLFRDDLKQYSTDAAVALVVWWLLARLEQQWTRRRIVALGAAAAAGFLFSAPAAFVGAAAFGVLVVLSAARRQWRRTLEAGVVGGLCGVVLGTFYLVLYRPGIPPDLHDYWAYLYLPWAKGGAAVRDFLGDQWSQMAGFLGMGPTWVVVLLLLAGVATLLRLSRPASAYFVPVLTLEMVVLAGGGQYPLFDLRTSHFLTMIFATTAAVGVVGVCSLIPWARSTVPAAGAVIAVALMLINPAVRSVIRGQLIPAENVRDPAVYVAAHLDPGDLVLVNMTSNWAFAYYWPIGSPAIQPVTSNLQRFISVFPDQPNIFVATGRDQPAVEQVVDRLAAAAALRGSNARIWFVHQHFTVAERQFYTTALAVRGLRSTVVQGDRLELLTPVAG